MRNYTYFNEISDIHNIVQSVKTSNINDELKNNILNAYNSLLLTFKILSDGHVFAVNQILSNNTLSAEFLTKMVNANNNLEKYAQNTKNFIKEIKLTDHKFNRIAVIFVGHLRTFVTCLPNNMHFFNKMSKTVDYYLITWDQSDYTSSDYQRDNLLDITKVKQNFDIEIYFGSLLKGVKVIDSSIVNFDMKNQKNRGLSKLINLTYLSKLGNEMKQTYEKTNNFVYDQVIETRPDIVHYPDEQKEFPFFFKCDNNDLITDLSIWNVMPSSKFLIGNWYWRMNSETHNKFSQMHDFLITKTDSDLEDYEAFHSSLNEYFIENTYNIQKGLDSHHTAHVKTPDDLTPI